MKLIVQPEAGLGPLVTAVRSARRSIDIVIFRFDRAELEKALEAAVARGVTVRALIAHTNKGGEKRLRKLELKLLDAGITVARTADDLPRYHGKMMIVDGTLHVFGFNYTKLDMEKSRSFGFSTTNERLVKEAASLFEADATRQPYTPGHPHLVVSPETSRQRLTEFISQARKELLIYDAKISDRLMLRVLAERVRAGVAIRLIGKLGKLAKGSSGIEARKLADLRLHVRAMIRDGSAAFVGSQSLRKLELDGRREVGVIVKDRRIAQQMRAVFESDWSHSAMTAEPSRPREAERPDADAGRETKGEVTSGA